MSIASEISRLQTAKANLKIEIENKGVVVPSGATLDSYPTYVSNIPSGGGENKLNQYFNKELVRVEEEDMSGVTEVFDNMFSGQTELEYIYFPSSISNIGAAYGVIRECPNLREINFQTVGQLILPNSDISHLTGVTIGSGVTSIYSWGFLDNCHELEVVRMESSTPPVIQSIYTFPRHTVIEIPEGSYDAYRSAQYWQEYDLEEYYLDE